MGADHFTTEERAGDVQGSLRLLGRYLREVPYVRALLIPNVFFALVPASLYQLFMWVGGKLAECGSLSSCAPVEILWGIRLEPAISLLALLAAVVIVGRFIEWCVMECGGQLASRRLLGKMVHGVARVRTTFFDEYPSGKIINRLVKDADQLRAMAPIRIGDSTASVVELSVTAAVMGIASPWAAAVAFPMLLFFFYVQRNVAPMLQRTLMLRSARFGEVIHRETDVIEGVRTFVLYGQLSALMGRLSGTLYRFMQMHFLRGTIEAWGRFLSDVGIALYGTGVLVVVCLGLHYGTLSPVMGVVVVSASFRLGSVFSWLTWSFGLMFETAGHAQRVFDYVDLPNEESEEGLVPAMREDAPRLPEGDLRIEAYSMSYRPQTPVIFERLSLSIERSTKVGLIGRTGAGKSSIVQALFRMVYVRGGDIKVGKDSILAMPIEQARALFAVVPQDPYLFEGTVRSNVDRLGDFSDEQVEAALKAVQLPIELSTKLLEGGSNLSLGQRQLVCLARVVLSKRPFVIMDEPTSGVDAITDAIIQGVLREALGDRTIITIAHRLETLARMDRIIELEHGMIVRDGTPSEIMRVITPEELA